MENDFNIEYVRVNRDNSKSCTDFMTLGYEYMKETAPDKSFEVQSKFLNSVLNRQNENEKPIIHNLLKIFLNCKPGIKEG